jgi:hypothetical protein
MTDQPESLILRHLQDIRGELRDLRADNTAQFSELRAQVAVLAKAQVAMRIQTKELGDKFDGMAVHMQEIAIVLDHSSDRLDRIERHLGLDTSKH